MSFEIFIEPEVFTDIQENIDWYNKQKAGLGFEFYNVVLKSFKILKLNPFYRIRYENVRCLPIKTFPFMIHFTVNEVEKLIIIRAILSTSRNPKIWKERK